MPEGGLEPGFPKSESNYTTLVFIVSLGNDPMCMQFCDNFQSRVFIAA